MRVGGCVVPDVDDKNLYSSCVVSKLAPRKDYLESVQTIVCDAYDEYFKCAPYVESLMPRDFNSNEIEALNHCYDSPLSVFEEVRDIIFNNAIADDPKCPYCSLDSISELDHYLPKSVFPEFSVYSKNLVPSCGVCNKRKSDYSHVCGSVRPVIHPYFDSLDVSVIRANIQHRNGCLVAIYSVDVSSVNDACLARVIKEHFDRLELKKRYEVHANNAIARLVKGMNDDVDSIGDAKRSFMQYYRIVCNLYHVNHWEVVLFKGLLDFLGFLSFDRGGGMLIEVGSD